MRGVMHVSYHYDMHIIITNTNKIQKIDIRLFSQLTKHL